MANDPVELLRELHERREALREIECCLSGADYAYQPFDLHSTDNSMALAWLTGSIRHPFSCDNDPNPYYRHKFIL